MNKQRIDRAAAGQDDSASPYHVLIVDDIGTERLLLRTILSRDGYLVTEAASGAEALEALQRKEFDALVLDAMMPDVDGFQVCRHIREELGIGLLPIIMLTALDSADTVADGLRAGATDFVTKPYNEVELLARVHSSVTKKRLTDRLDDTESVLFALARMVEAKDSSTRDHCDRLSHMAVAFGQDLGCSYEELLALRRGGVLHDIGKLGVPDAVLLKQGPLDEAEREAMQQHPVIGAQLCSPLRTMRRTLDIIRHHHETWNGVGYPDRLAGERIPFLARVFQILDVYDALSHERPYKEALPQEEVMSIMERETADGFWDEDLMQRFLRLVHEQPERLALGERQARSDSARIIEDIFTLAGVRHAS